MTAVLKSLKEKFPNSKYHIVGHSAGGQLVGLMDNIKEVSSIFNFGCSSGSIHNASFPFVFKSLFFLKGVIPISNLLFGHTKSQWFGMGEPLPKKVAAQWSKWCSGKGYVAVDFGKEIKHHQYNEITIPTIWYHASDDEIANIANVKDMTRVFKNAKVEIVTLHPTDFGFKDLGHMKFFSSKRKVLWKYALEWFDKFK